jgi:predicted NBD/HSP70 family sugar kinase
MDGVECACGSRGCFEPTVAFRHYEAALGDDLSSFADFGAALRATRRPEVSALLDRDAEYLGRVLRSIVLVYDPEMIMLGGFLTGVLEQRRAELERAVAAATLTAISRPPLLQPTQFGADQLLVGAGALAFRGLLDDPADFLLDVDREASPA